MDTKRYTAAQWQAISSQQPWKSVDFWRGMVWGASLMWLVGVLALIW